jgi:hypothetical protein
VNASLPRRVGVLLAGLAIAAGLVAVMVPSATADSGDQVTASLKAAHVGATNPGFTEGECPSEGWGWHFVLPGDFTDFVSVTATFLVDGSTETVTAPDPATNSVVDGKHAYLFTSGPGVLTSATATVVLNEQGVELGKTVETTFNLSHVCSVETSTVPDDPTTTVPESTTTVPESTTTVPESTTTIPHQSTTTISESNEVPSLTSTPQVEVLGETVVADTATPAAESGRLAFTGSNTGILLVAALGLLLTGGALHLVARRRRGDATNS